jgi:hypothetical protein
MEQTDCSEAVAYKIQTLGHYPEESIQHLEHGKSFKNQEFLHLFIFLYFLFNDPLICTDCKASSGRINNKY